jgi:photosystem II stability/assembly factor-like uncharacterized protein
MTRRRIRGFFSIAITITATLSLLACSSSQWTGEWEFTNGPLAQNISTVIADRTNGSHLLAALTSGDLYRSYDRGKTWAHAGTIAPGVKVVKFLQHPDEKKLFYALTDAGIFSSSGDGDTWTPLVFPRSMPVRSLAIDPYNPRILFAGTAGNGLLRSTDAGESWNPLLLSVDSSGAASSIVNDICIEPTRPDHIYAAVKGIGVVKSTDGGTSWKKLTGMIGSGGIVPTSIVAHPQRAGVICYGMEGGSIYKTIDGGETWSPTRFGAGSDSPVQIISSPLDPEVLLAGTENDILQSKDFGSSWTSIGGTLPHVATALAVGRTHNDLLLIAYGEGLGLCRSEDTGKSWGTDQPRLGGSTVSELHGSRSGNQLLGVVGSSVHVWDANSRLWASRSNGLIGGTIASLALSPDTIAISSVATPSGIFGTTNGGATWSAIQNQLRGRSVELISSHTIFTTRILAASNNEVFASTNGGLTWAPTKPLNDRCRITWFTYSPVDAGFVIGATKESGVRISTDGGMSWQPSSYGLGDASIARVTLDDKDRSTLYAWTPEGNGFRSTNKGIVWDRYSPPWPQGSNVRLVFDRFKPSEVVALVDCNELYVSVSGGGTWFAVPITPVSGTVTALYWNSASATLYAGVQNTGVYRLVLKEYLRKRFEGE